MGKGRAMGESVGFMLVEVVVGGRSIVLLYYLLHLILLISFYRFDWVRFNREIS